MGRRLQDGGWFSTGIVHRTAPIHRFLGTTPYYQKNGRAASRETRVKNQERSHIDGNRLIGGNPQSPRNSDRFGEETMNQDMIPLNRVPEGRVARVIDLFTTGNMRRRLQDIGLIEGTDVECLQKSPGRGPGRLLHSRGGHRAALGGFPKHTGALQLKRRHRGRFQWA